MNIRKEENVFIIKLIPESVDNSQTNYKSILKLLEESNIYNLVLDMEDLKYLISSEIGFIAWLLSKIKEKKGKMFFLNHCESIRISFEITGILDFIILLDDIDELKNHI